jgi:chromosome segregation ATPase
MSSDNYMDSRSTPVRPTQKLAQARQEIDKLQQALRNLMETMDAGEQSLEAQSAEIEESYHQLLDGFAALDLLLYNMQLSLEDGLSQQDGHVASESAT